MQLEKDIQLKKGDTIEILFNDDKTDYVKIKDNTCNKLKITDDANKIKRIRVRRQISKHLDEIIFNSDNEMIKENNMELKDIVLKKGDVICFENEDKIAVNGFEDFKATEIFISGKITKIKRPVKYKTIYEAPKQILDKEEKEYLEAVIRPFKNRVIYIKKDNGSNNLVFIQIRLKHIKNTTLNDDIMLPFFKEGTMYKGMETEKGYTLEELGLFKE